MEQERFRETDPSSGIQKRFHSVIGGRFQHDFVEESGLAIAAGAAELGVLVVVEGVIRGLAEVATAEDVVAK